MSLVTLCAYRFSYQVLGHKDGHLNIRARSSIDDRFEFEKVAAGFSLGLFNADAKRSTRIRI